MLSIEDFGRGKRSRGQDVEIGLDDAARFECAAVMAAPSSLSVCNGAAQKNRTPFFLRCKTMTCWRTKRRTHRDNFDAHC